MGLNSCLCQTGFKHSVNLQIDCFAGSFGCLLSDLSTNFCHLSFAILALAFTDSRMVSWQIGQDCYF